MMMFLFYSVKLRIKSFRVPELFIEISETATVASLKVQYNYILAYTTGKFYCAAALTKFWSAESSYGGSDYSTSRWIASWYDSPWKET